MKIEITVIFTQYNVESIVTPDIRLDVVICNGKTRRYKPKQENQRRKSKNKGNEAIIDRYIDCESNKTKTIDIGKGYRD